MVDRCRLLRGGCQVLFTVDTITGQHAFLMSFPAGWFMDAMENANGIALPLPASVESYPVAFLAFVPLFFDVFFL